MKLENIGEFVRVPVKLDTTSRVPTAIDDHAFDGGRVGGMR
jgi:hypothetical protein